MSLLFCHDVIEIVFRGVRIDVWNVLKMYYKIIIHI